MLTKAQKISFVNTHKKELKSYKVVGIVQCKGIPDRLLQSTKNRLKGSTKFIMGRKSLLTKILESDERTKPLVGDLTDTSAIILTNEDPFEVYNKFKSNSLKLAAKPGQISPEDVNIQAGETGIQPGQTVTDLKSAGIDVQIQKGKVVIAKDKTLVKKGDVISGNIAKALHTLDILPFMAVMAPSSIFADGMIFTSKVLGITQETTTQEIMIGFRSALSLSLEANIINAYTIEILIAKAHRTAMHVGLEAKVLDSGIIELLLASATLSADALNSTVGVAAPAEEKAEEPAAA